MLFNSPEFGLFALLVVAGWHAAGAGGWPARKLLLTLASLLFYASWNPWFGLLLLGSAVANYGLGRWIERRRGPGVLALAVTANLLPLAFFKYAGFLAATVQLVLGGGDPPLADIVLPIGISFFTFEALAYTVDVHRGAPACRSFLDFALFLSFFPHLVAGPIVRPQQFLPQLDAPPPGSGATVEAALARIAQGFVKKLVLADGLGHFVDQVWATPSGAAAGDVVLAVYAYAYQIYFDFSGYTDIALGLAGLFGLRLPENFDRPYRAASPREFWQRWHISLSTWLRDYLYLPLGGNRGSAARTRLNLLITMVLGGLWHGAAWTFVLWGAVHGALLIGHRAIAGRVRVPGDARVGRLVTFHLVCAAWILFRAPDLDAAATVLARLAHPGWMGGSAGLWALALLVLAVILHAVPPADAWRQRFTALPPWLQGLGYAAATVAMLFLAPPGARFIYFQF